MRIRFPLAIYSHVSGFVGTGRFVIRLTVTNRLSPVKQTGMLRSRNTELLRNPIFLSIRKNPNDRSCIGEHNKNPLPAFDYLSEFLQILTGEPSGIPRSRGAIQTPNRFVGILEILTGQIRRT